MKVLLVTPPYHCGVVEVAGAWMPLNYVCLAGELEKDGHQVVIYDAMTLRHTHNDILSRLAAEKADVVAAGAITPTYPDSVEVLRSAKKLNPKVVTVLGGVHPTFCHEEILEKDGDAVDFIVAGEGERVFARLLREVRSRESEVGKKIWKDNEFIEDLDELTPAWHLLDWGIYTYYIKKGSRLALGVLSNRLSPVACGVVIKKYTNCRCFTSFSASANSGGTLKLEIAHSRHTLPALPMCQSVYRPGFQPRSCTGRHTNALGMGDPHSAH